MTDNSKLHETYDLTTQFTELVKSEGSRNPCGCIRRGDGEFLRYCQRDNVRRGTHGNWGHRDGQ